MLSRLVTMSLFVAIPNILLADTLPAPYEAPSTIVRDDIHYAVEADGTYVVEEIETDRINSDQGVKSRAQISLSYSTSLQSLDILEAYTTTKDGRRLDVTSDKILLQESAVSRYAPTFDDTKVKVIVFPSVEVGATITLHYKKKQNKPIFPGQFSMFEVFSKNTEIQSEQLTLTAPKSLALGIDAQGVEGGEVPSDDSAHKTWRWHVENAHASTPQAIAVSASDYSPHVAVSTFSSYEDVARAYTKRAGPTAAVTPDIQSLADDITRGVDDKRAQATALYKWVSKNVRYVAIYLGFGGVVPHSASDVARLRYGDCKDHVTLLQALLAAKGIKSSPVLLNASASYKLPAVPMVMGAFDHAITYLPDFDLFVDSTPGIATFGVLPIMERGKQALVIDDGSGKSRLVSLPLTDTQSNAVHVKTKLAMDSEGNVDGASEVSGTGVFEMLSRQIFESVPKGQESQLATNILTYSGQTGTGTYNFEDPRDLDSAFRYKTQFKLPNYAALPGPGAMGVPAGLGSLSSIASTFDAAREATHEFPMAIVNGHRDETTVITLPSNVSVSALPKPSKIETPFGRYESSYAKQGATIVVTRTLDLFSPTPTLDSKAYAAFRTFGLAVARDLKAQILYQ